MTSSTRKLDGLMGPLVSTAAALGIVQGLSWTLLSIAGILIYTGAVVLSNVDSSSIGTQIGPTIFSLYLDKDYTASSEYNIIIKPGQFYTFLFIYLVLSLCLLVVSSLLTWALITGKRERIYYRSIGCWTLMVVFLSFLDLILMCLIAHDYEKYQTAYEEFDETYKATGTIILTSVGIVMTIAARGFILWILNVALAVVLGKHYYDLHKEEVARNQPAIGAYAHGPRPWIGASMYSNDPMEYDNKGFSDDNGNSTFAPQSRQNQSQDNNNYSSNKLRENDILKKPSDNFWNNRNQNREDITDFSSRPYSGERDSPYTQPAPLKTAKIGRQAGQRSPPLNVSPPFIPDPDYSPPGSPKVRGVLRPKSNYIMF